MLKRVLSIALALVLGLAVPALALTQAQAEALVAKVTKDKVIVKKVDTDEANYSNAAYIHPGLYCSWFQCMQVDYDTIMFIQGKDVPDDYVIAILLHELGHKAQNDSFHTTDGFDEAYNKDPKGYEWDADEYAIRMLYKLGYDPYMVEKALMSFWRNEGYAGDYHHGLLAWRVKSAHEYANKVTGRTDIQL